MKKPLKILIVRLSAIGDVIHTTPILHSLRQKFPDANISWVVEDKAAEIINNNPLINKVFIIPKQKWKKRGLSIENLKEFLSLVKEIRSENFDIAIDVQELFKSGLITFLSGAKRRIAHAGTREFAHIFVNEKLPAHNNFDPEKLIIERYLEPAAYLGAPVDEVKFSIPPINSTAIDKIDKLLKNSDNSKPIIIFSPSTIWPTKHWIEEYWTELLDCLNTEYNIIFTGTEKDNELIKRITSKAKTGNYQNFAGKTSLFELIELFKRADIIIGPDTGPLHIANAVEKPKIIMIFGPTGYKRTPPVGEKHVAISHNLSCQPCFKRECLRNNKMECMKNITPEKILSIIKQANISR